MRFRHFLQLQFGLAILGAGVLVMSVPLIGTAHLIVNESLSVVPSETMQQYVKDNPSAVIYFGESGYANRIHGQLSSPLGDRDPVEVTFEFLEASRELFGMREPREEWRLLRDEELEPSDGTRYLLFQQMYKGLPVPQGALISGFGRSPRGIRITVTHYQRNITLPDTSQVSKDEAIRIVQDDLGKPFAPSTYKPSVDEPTLIVNVWEGQYYLAWEVKVPRCCWYYINALSGEIIHRRRIIDL